MSLLARLGDLLADAFAQVGADPSFGAVEWSNRPDLGQFQCNGALAAAKSLGRNPREIAQQIVDLLPAQGVFADVSIAGPGFINLTLDDTYLADGLATRPSPHRGTTSSTSVARTSPSRCMSATSARPSSATASNGC